MTLTAQFPAPAETVLPVAYEAACLLLGPRKKAVEGENFLCLPLLLAHMRFEVPGFIFKNLITFIISAKPLGEDRCEITISADYHSYYKQDEGSLMSFAAVILRNTATALLDPQ